MILQALVQYYEALLARGEIDRGLEQSQCQLASGPKPGRFPFRCFSPPKALSKR